MRADGGIGRHVRLRGVCASVRVQVPLRAPFNIFLHSGSTPKVGAAGVSASDLVPSLISSKLYFSK